MNETVNRKLAVLLIWKGQLQDGTNSVNILHGCQEFIETKNIQIELITSTFLNN